MLSQVALTLKNICVRYGPRKAVDSVSLEVHRGEIVGLLGPNGSGKSSVLAVAAGVIQPIEGTVDIEGIDRATDPIGFAHRVGMVPQECGLYDELTAIDNLNFFGKLYGLSGSDLRRRVARVLSRVRLTDRAAHRINTFSGGMKQKLNLAVALIHDPLVLLLDEPTAALDPASRDAFYADLTYLRDDGHAVLLTTHHLDEAELGCDRVAVLNRGKLMACGKPAELLRCGSTERPVLYGQLRVRPPKFLERAIRGRLNTGVELEMTGRRLRLTAPNAEDLGRALASLLAEGVELEAYRTPVGTLERVLRDGNTSAELSSEQSVGVPDGQK
ncbi:MAG TPA: ABC transporter ATP-binding protein [Gemmata sp.]|jgi:ABC-2 type transport system ATP-binding protein|nr:ABC transporter ATP-binding protein [Gemmata sp.]